MSSQMSENALEEFFSECEEILQRFSIGLSQVEKNGAKNGTQLDALYRDIHTMKGSAQLFGFQPIGQIAHAMEASLEPIRRLKLDVPPKLADSLFKCVDLIDRILKETKGGKAPPAGKFDKEIQVIVPRLLSEASRRFGGELPLWKDSFVGPEKPSLNSLQKISKPGIVSIATQESAVFQASLESAADLGSGDPALGDVNSTVRIQVGLLDKLMNLVGEMVLVRNQVTQYSQKVDDLEFLNLSQRLDAVTSELQGDVMKTRMQPISSILGKFQRVVRDLARDLGKKIEFNIHGGDTELDKTLLEAIRDPLTHIIRNCCDHGLETTEERAEAGKSPIGNIRIRAFHESGQVIVEVMDDGRGLNYPRILEKALERKLITKDRASSLTDREIGQFIFAPGFSTAERVSSVSGRGVGMDVVKCNLEKIGGQVELDSEPNKGMTIRMRIPLTLAIIPALIVRISKELFAIPLVKVVELVRVEKEGLGQKIEQLQGKPVFRLRGALLSIVNLGEVMQLKDQEAVTDSINIAVLSTEHGVFGLIVDEIKDTTDIVVKPLSNFLKRISIYSGATVMGDGTVSLILDISGLAQKANLFQKPHTKREYLDDAAALREAKNKLEIQDFLFFSLNSKEKYCLPVCLVHRLEEFPIQEIEFSGNQKIVKYRDSILPLIDLNGFLKNPELTDVSGLQMVPVVVVQKMSRLFGLVVTEVLDILSVRGAIESPIHEVQGVLGSLIVENEVATVLDVLGMLDLIMGVATDPAGSQSLQSSSQQSLKLLKDAHVLLAEDTGFFVKQIQKILEVMGVRVTHAMDGLEAWNILAASKTGEYQLVVSDIEMPNVNGFELVEKIRGDERFTGLPVIAVTTRFREADQERGRKVGFTRYLEKLRADQLQNAIRECLGERPQL